MMPQKTIKDLEGPCVVRGTPWCPGTCSDILIPSVEVAVVVADGLEKENALIEGGRGMVDTRCRVDVMVRVLIPSSMLICWQCACNVICITYSLDRRILRRRKENWRYRYDVSPCVVIVTKPVVAAFCSW